MPVVSPNAKISALADIEDSLRGSKIITEDGVAIDSFAKIEPVGGMDDVIIGAGRALCSGCGNRSFVH